MGDFFNFQKIITLLHIVMYNFFLQSIIEKKYYKNI